MAETTIRPAEPSDADFLAWLILTAGRAHVGRGIWEVILGRPEEACLKFLELLSTTVSPHFFHYSCYLVAEVGGAAKAGLGGYDPRTAGNAMLLQALPEVFGQLGRGAPGSLQGGSPPRITACIPEPVEGAWVIDSVAAAPEVRRQGVVSALLEAIMQRGREQGFCRAQITIYLGNTPAQRLYEKHGFAVVDEIRDPYFEAEIGSPGMARMLRDL